MHSPRPPSVHPAPEGQATDDAKATPNASAASASADGNAPPAGLTETQQARKKSKWGAQPDSALTDGLKLLLAPSVRDIDVDAAVGGSNHHRHATAAAAARRRAAANGAASAAASMLARPGDGVAPTGLVSDTMNLFAKTGPRAGIEGASGSGSDSDSGSIDSEYGGTGVGAGGGKRAAGAGGGGGTDGGNSSGSESDEVHRRIAQRAETERRRGCGARACRRNRRRLFRVLVLGRPVGSSDAWLAGILKWALFLSVLSVMSETVHFQEADAAHLEDTKLVLVRVIEYVATAVFAIEILLRTWVCSEHRLFPRRAGCCLGRLCFMLRPASLTDLLFVAPLPASLLLGVDIFDPSSTGDGVVNTLRLIRVCRLFKFHRYSASAHHLLEVVRRKREELATSLTLSLFVVILLSVVVFYAEHDANTDEFPNLVGSLWWGVTTLTTVGYGDIVTRTSLGRLFGGVGAVLGIGLFTLPAGLVASGYLELRQEHTATLSRLTAVIVRTKRRALLASAFTRMRQSMLRKRKTFGNFDDFLTTRASAKAGGTSGGGGGAGASAGTDSAAEDQYLEHLRHVHNIRAAAAGGGSGVGGIGGGGGGPVGMVGPDSAMLKFALRDSVAAPAAARLLAACGGSLDEAMALLLEVRAKRM